MKPIVIQSMYNQFRHSVMQKLTKAINEICDDEFLWVNHLGHTLKRDELINGIEQINYEKWNSTNQNVRFFENSAILTGLEVTIILRDGQKQTVHTFVTVVFIKRESGWKLISGQSTEITKTIV